MEKNHTSHQLKSVILSHELLTYKLHKLCLSKPDNFFYMAGQYIKLYYDNGIFNYYSIANAPNANFLEFHIQEPVTNIQLKNFLFTCNINQEIIISPPLGHIHLSNIDQPMIFIANGCGFSPIKAILENLRTQNNVKYSVYLYWCIESWSNIYYLTELKALKEANQWFHYEFILETSQNNQLRKKVIEKKINFIFKNKHKLQHYLLYASGSKTIVEQIYYLATKNSLPKNNFFCDYDNLLIKNKEE